MRITWGSSGAATPWMSSADAGRSVASEGAARRPSPNHSDAGSIPPPQRRRVRASAILVNGTPCHAARCVAGRGLVGSAGATGPEDRRGGGSGRRGAVRALQPSQGAASRVLGLAIESPDDRHPCVLRLFAPTAFNIFFPNVLADVGRDLVHPRAALTMPITQSVRSCDR